MVTVGTGGEGSTQARDGFLPRLLGSEQHNSKWDAYFPPYTKLNSEWFTGLSVRTKTVQENVGVNLHDIKSMNDRGKNKLDLIKM